MGWGLTAPLLRETFAPFSFRGRGFPLVLTAVLRYVCGVWDHKALTPPYQRGRVMFKTFKTPGGHEAQIHCREGTNDAMVAEAVIKEDEYRRYSLIDRTGARYIDIGSHIGTWIIAALLDDPDGTGTAVEVIPDNVEMIQKNLAANGLTDRVQVPARAFAKKGPVTILYGFDAPPGASEEQQRMAAMHRFIGNQRMPERTGCIKVAVPAVTPSALFKGKVDAVKIDIEGGEVALVGANLKKVGVISGEYHIPRGPLYEHMSKTHRVMFDGNETFGYFTAVPK